MNKYVIKKNGKKRILGEEVVSVNANGNYKHIQTVASAKWTVTHNLGYMPAGVYVEDSAGTQWYGTLDYIDVNNLTIDFDNASFGGFALFS